mmetsp:Transcript_19294/g.46612  ORF Transcript_19294/g.46612 Transcript_19294/m.46612 type:complete len:203 (+) Transcript_19294:737-1345(+)
MQERQRPQLLCLRASLCCHADPPPPIHHQGTHVLIECRPGIQPAGQRGYATDKGRHPYPGLVVQIEQKDRTDKPGGGVFAAGLVRLAAPQDDLRLWRAHDGHRVAEHRAGWGACRFNRLPSGSVAVISVEVVEGHVIGFPSIKVEVLATTHHSPAVPGTRTYPGGGSRKRWRRCNGSAPEFCPVDFSHFLARRPLFAQRVGE